MIYTHNETTVDDEGNPSGKGMEKLLLAVLRTYYSDIVQIIECFISE